MPPAPRRFPAPVVAPSRREFLRTAGVAAAGLLAGLPAVTKAAILPQGGPSASKLPRWRGFNLLEKFDGSRNQPYRAQDFAWMREWGFDFARLPMSYHCWAKPTDWLTLNEAVLREVDQAVTLGRRHGIHVNINFHRIPGYCVNVPPNEPYDLWKDEPALTAAAFHWRTFAKRYRGIPSQELSFDLINEPANVAEADYVRVITRLVETIRQEDPDRLIVADGLQYGTLPVFGLASLGVGQSTRGYNPMQVSHYQATWVAGIKEWTLPTWPMRVGDTLWNKAYLKANFVAPWQELERRDVGIHVGEWGAYNHTPHAVALAWMRDCLSLWQEAGWGWSLWNLRGNFGILDSDRRDVAYENHHGAKLDRRMLELLREY